MKMLEASGPIFVQLRRTVKIIGKRVRASDFIFELGILTSSLGSITMSFSALRSFSRALPAMRRMPATMRAYATAPAAKSNVLLYGALGAGVLGAGYYASQYVADEKVEVVVKAVDYQKVYNA